MDNVVRVAIVKADLVAYKGIVLDVVFIRIIDVFYGKVVNKNIKKYDVCYHISLIFWGYLI